MNVVGIDFGGTKIHSGLVNDKGNILKSAKLMTNAEKGKDTVIQNIIETVKKLGNDFSAIGVGAAGPVSNGILHDPPNLSGLSGVNLAEILGKEFKVPVFVDNDAKCFLSGEKMFGCAKNFDNVVALTLGTGVGGAILIDGKLYRGTDGTAGELGHMVVKMDGFDCRCGNKGCLEMYASGHGITSIAQDYIDKGKYAPVPELGSVLIQESARNGDKFALKVMDDMGSALGVGLANIVNIFNPQLIVIGGSVCNAWDLFEQRMIEVMHERAFELPAKNVKVMRSVLGEDSAILGAASLCFNKNNKDKKK